MPRLDGIDIYHGQADKGPVELGKVAAIPTWWFAAKATQSTSFRDPMFDTFMVQAKPLFSHRLGYHWLSSITDPLQQADWFLASTSGADGIGAMIDIEEAGDTVAKAKACFERIENHTHRPGVGYSGLYVTGGTIWNSPELRMSAYGPRPFIVAAYVALSNLQTRMATLHSLPYDGWQFSSSGPVNGIVGRCDMDQIDNIAAFDLACGISHPQLEEDMAYIVTNADPQTGAEGPGVGAAGPRENKFRVLEDGRVKPQSLTDLKALGLVDSLELGVPLTNDELAEKGYWSPLVLPAAHVAPGTPVTVSWTEPGAVITAQGTLG